MLRCMNQPRRAPVVAGGIACHSVALFLARAGIEPVVFEAYPRTDDVGGGFQIAPNGLRVMANLGVADAILQAGHACHDFCFRNHRGRDIGLVETRRAGPAVNVARKEVHRVLRAECERLGIPVRYEKRLKEITLAGPDVVATFEDGSTEVGDILLVADEFNYKVQA